MQQIVRSSPIGSGYEKLTATHPERRRCWSSGLIRGEKGTAGGDWRNSRVGAGSIAGKASLLCACSLLDY